MRYLYLIAGSAIALAGIYYIVDPFIQVTQLMDEIGVIAGLVFLYLGTLNILNYWYGSKARGVRWGAVGANAVMLGICWIIGANPVGLEWGVIAALLLAAALSVSNRFSRPA